MRYRLIAVCALFSLCFAAFAQTGRGGITTTINDSTGAVVVPNAPVEVVCHRTDSRIFINGLDSSNFFLTNSPNRGILCKVL
jgi:hypothetical protein